jgi:hypothetical protein
LPHRIDSWVRSTVASSTACLMKSLALWAISTLSHSLSLNILNQHRNRHKEMDSGRCRRRKRGGKRVKSHIEIFRRC